MASWTLEDLENWTDMSIIPNVIKLNITSCSRTDIPLKVFKLITLQELNYSFNGLSFISCVIQIVLKLIAFQDLGCIPKEIGQLINLKHFSCDNNRLTRIPKEMGQLINLQYFNCSGNKFKNLPNEIGQLINLQKFYCHNNELTGLPKEIGQLINLQEFDCSYNKITMLPNEIGQLINLKHFSCNNEYFSCDNNRLTRIPKEIGQLINLQYFSCHNNKLTRMPKEIGQLINLQEFNCSYNKLTNLPNEIGQLINLQIFRCYYNELTNLPNEIGQLINLQHFDCSYNQLINLPNEIGQLINLQRFDCSNNQLTNLPNEIGQLINLQKFICYNNPITYIPPNINRTLNRIKNHQNIYKDQQNVHNHDIQNCIRQSINNIIQIKPSISNLETFILENKLLNDKTKSLLFDYILNEDLFNNITFKELLFVVLTIIETKPNKNDIYEILNQEINDAECKCLTGRISRLINVLNGQDERIIINISDKEQIGNIIVLIRNNLGNDYTVEKHKELVIKELKERGFNEDIINEYINFIE
jgi:Leucine-rich repeat (LRR) protein